MSTATRFKVTHIPQGRITGGPYTMVTAICPDAGTPGARDFNFALACGRYEAHPDPDALIQDIVDRCNQHDELVSALQFVLKATDEWPGTMRASIDAIRERCTDALP